MDRVIILGASRGLGAELVKHLGLSGGVPTFGFARKEAPLLNLREQFPLFAYRIADFSSRTGQDEVIRFLLSENYNRVICVAGGGPYGNYGDRALKDHEWAWEVTFHFQARVLHALLAERGHHAEQVIFVGSSVAESGPDPRAASYCAAKHALKGLVMSARAESPNLDIRLFSPGFMDTEMLPANAAVRKAGVYSPADMARDLWDWCLSADKTGHRVYPRHPA